MQREVDVSNNELTVRTYVSADADLTMDIFLRAIREVASKDYNQAQVDAWAEGRRQGSLGETTVKQADLDRPMWERVDRICGSGARRALGYDVCPSRLSRHWCRQSAPDDSRDGGEKTRARANFYRSEPYRQTVFRAKRLHRPDVADGGKAWADARKFPYGEISSIDGRNGQSLSLVMIAPEEREIAFPRLAQRILRQMAI